ncbi:HAD family hydrolase [Thermobifida fusca]|jgi:mannitol-1-/sugar-/sorbitol-6-phosphatase|uniref:HAD family hydrolase n=1 Tax=Thermobifida fusca TM51 TaxID=1169414 RepID=A0A9P2T8C2_THEFU|nr:MULTISPECIES: HAD family phosphatase [Thermobifida]EOR70417.1 HAD family hydrolase [Thermobifida fusca TM51]MBO2530480.1 HAD family phosphatase [Thermobifida sp.]PPS93844.1 HAD family hydrolase [Thermobifida fusca]QOS58989.1 HAD family phosphatase [Thermobifida fusca]
MGLRTTESEWATPRAALFDLDGTLINSEPRSVAVWARVLQDRGVEPDEALLRKFMGRRGEDVINELAHLFPGESVEDIFADRWRYGQDPDLPPVEQLPESVAFLKYLHAQGVPFALVTSAGRQWAESTLEWLGVRDMFRGIISADDVTVGKPHPEGYLSGAELVGYGPEHIVVFEDTPAGIMAGRNAGMRVVGVTTTHPPQALAHAHLVVEHLGQVGWPQLVLRDPEPPQTALAGQG